MTKRSDLENTKFNQDIKDKLQYLEDNKEILVRFLELDNSNIDKSILDMIQSYTYYTSKIKVRYKDIHSLTPLSTEQYLGSLINMVYNDFKEVPLENSSYN